MNPKHAKWIINKLIDFEKWYVFLHFIGLNLIQFSQYLSIITTNCKFISYRRTLDLNFLLAGENLYLKKTCLMLQ